jgi:hypothetical protein
MGVVEQLITAVLLAELVAAITLLVTAFRISPEAPAARFHSGWLGAFGLMSGLGSCTGLAALLAEFGTGSAAGVVAAVVLNLVVQPFALLMCWSGVRKITLGLRGRLAFAWRQVPESELADLPLTERKQLCRYCVFQGVVVLPLGVFFSLACASPLIRLFCA